MPFVLQALNDLSSNATQETQYDQTLTLLSLLHSLSKVPLASSLLLKAGELFFCLVPYTCGSLCTAFPFLLLTLPL